MIPSMPAQQAWVCRLSIMMQSVLFAAVRAPDGLRKDHPVKVIMRWYRRSVLLSAFDGRPLDDPFSDGGGSFTGPFNAHHMWHFVAPHRGWSAVEQDWRTWKTAAENGDEPLRSQYRQRMWNAFNEMREVYLRHVDEMPHHFQLHLMHAAQIVGHYHILPDTAMWWQTFYLMIVNDAHLRPELLEDLKYRLSDNEKAWREREGVPAR